MSRPDPVTLEVIQNRLTQIGWEAGIALQKTTTSPAVLETKDFGFNIADHLGRTIVYSIWMPRHGTTLAFMLRSCLRKFGQDGIHPDDMIMVNNPYDGALHLPDIAIIAPVHYNGELIGWVANATHSRDIRASVTESAATEWFQEGLVFSPIKLVERGQLRQDIFDFFLDNVRFPHYQGIDLKAQIAANSVAKERLQEVARRYGLDTIKACYEEILNFSEAQTRQRIRELPNGRYEAVDYLDFDQLYTYRCTLTVEDDTLTFDFTGTDPEAKTYINSAYPCSVANLHNIFTIMLIPDIVANEGCFRPVKIIIPEGTLLNCRPPAPCGGASTKAARKVQCLTLKVLSLALEHSSQSWRCSADWGWSILHLQLYGRWPDGRLFRQSGSNDKLQGGGARATKDGFDVSHIAASTNTSIGNIEWLEQRLPILYLYRGFAQDSGGTGKYRGGLAGESVVKLYGVSEAQGSVTYVGKDLGAEGFAGGESGATSIITVKKDSNINELLKEKVPSFAEIRGEEVIFPQKGVPFKVGVGDVFYSRCQGGGGYGRPEERDPELVLWDVLEGYVSREKAREVYRVAVVGEPPILDLEETERLRGERPTTTSSLPSGNRRP